jgi:hypothetical protein
MCFGRRDEEEVEIEVLPVRPVPPIDVMTLTLREVAVPTAASDTTDSGTALHKGARCLDIRCKTATLVLRAVEAFETTDPIFLYMMPLDADDVEAFVVSLEEILGPRLYRAGESEVTTSIYDTPLGHLLHKVVVLVEAKEMPKPLVSIGFSVTNAMRRISDKDPMKATFVNVDYDGNKEGLNGFKKR